MPSRSASPAHPPPLDLVGGVRVGPRGSGVAGERALEAGELAGEGGGGAGEDRVAWGDDRRPSSSPRPPRAATSGSGAQPGARASHPRGRRARRRCGPSSSGRSSRTACVTCRLREGRRRQPARWCLLSARS
jgi:hypothetical protein